MAHALKIGALGMAAMLFCAEMATADGVRIDNTFTVDGVTFNDGSGSVGVAFASKNADGKLALCGVYFVDGNGVVKAVARQVIQKLRFELRGKSLNVGAYHFNKVDSDGDTATMRARCKATDITWHDSFIKDGITLRGGRMNVVF